MQVDLTFRPRLAALLPSYSKAQFRRDFLAGLNVMILALPLSMAFAIAAGVARGVLTEKPGWAKAFRERKQKEKK